MVSAMQPRGRELGEKRVEQSTGKALWSWEWKESGYNERLEFLSSVPNIHEFSLQCTDEQTNLWPSSWLQQLCYYLKMFGLGFITVSLIDAEQRWGWWGWWRQNECLSSNCKINCSPTLKTYLQTFYLFIHCVRENVFIITEEIKRCYHMQS